MPVIVVGVLESKAEGGIGILATVGTCASGAYPKTITRTLGPAERSVPPIAQQGSATLAGAIEGDSAFPDSVSSYALKEARSLAEAYLALKPTKPLESIVLGFTHCPLAEAEIDAAFAHIRTEPAMKEVIAEKRNFVNPAQLTARELFRELALAKVNLRQVNQLNTGREMITPCRLSPFGLAAIINGGGTMYNHGAARDASEVEDFLAGVSADFPPAEGEGSAKAR